MRPGRMMAARSSAAISEEIEQARQEVWASGMRAEADLAAQQHRLAEAEEPIERVRELMKTL
jgi:hypothetical protein